jgi:glutamine amidotransferase
MRVAIVDFGMGNLRSIHFKLARADVDAVVSSDPGVIAAADRLILPGVGHFGAAMENLRRFGLIDALNESVLHRGTPILGICLGIQLFCRCSEEGNCAGLAWLDADVRRFSFPRDEGLRIPHIGWAPIRIGRPDPALRSVEAGQRFYFVHSYHVCCDDGQDVLATAEYGRPFTAAIRRENILGCQFHPEKSHRRGFRIITDWLNG